MSDIAKLGYAVDTSGLLKGERAMEKYAKKGMDTEKRIKQNVTSMNNTFNSLNSIIGKSSAKAFDQFQKQGKKTEQVFDRMVKNMERDFKRLNKTIRKTSMSGLGGMSTRAVKTEATVSRSLKSINKNALSLNNTLGLIGTALVFFGGVRLTRELIEYSDTWKNVNSQIRQVTKSEEELVKTRTALLKISSDTRSQLKGTVNLFAEMTRGTKELNISSERLLGVTRTLNNLFVSGGKPISETINALRQLNQGFAAGILRGDEFNSVAENAPRIMDALTEKLKITRGELREFAATGGLTAKILIDAIEDYSETAQKLADQTEKTFEQSMEISKNNTLEFIGSLEGLNKAISGTGLLIEDFTNNLDASADALQAILVVVGIGLTPTMIAYTRSLIATTAAQLTAGTTAIRTSNALGVITVTAASATVATNALTIATRFLLGPWGLLLTAIAAASFVFIESKNASELAEAQHDKHAKTLKKLADEYEKYSKGRLGDLYVKAQMKAIDIDTQRIRINKLLIDTENRKTASLERNAGGGKFKTTDIFSKQIKALKNQLKELNVVSEKQEKIMDAIGIVFEKGLPQISEMTNRTKEQTGSTAKQLKAQEKVNNSFLKQIDLLARNTLEITKTKDEYELLSAELDAFARGATPEMLDAIKSIILTNQELRKSIKFEDEFKDLQDSVENFGGAWTRTGSVIVDAFGNMSDSLNDYMMQVKEISKLEKEVAKSRVKLGKDNAEVIELQKTLDIERTRSELKGIRVISSAAESLFDEKTVAAKAFAALNKIITIAEIALSFQKMATGTAEAGVHVANETTKQSANALTAITSAFAAPFPINFIAGAAMIAIMGGLVGGIFGGSSGVGSDPTASNQDTQGTGTLLGSSEQSQSIVNSQKRFEDIGIDQLAELRSIRSSTNATALGISKLAGTFVGTGLGDFSGALGVTSESLGGLFNKTTKKVVDEGIIFISQSLGSIIENGIVKAEAFFAIETTKKKFFGLSKSTSIKTETQGIDNVIQEQMADIFGNIGDSVLKSAKLLGFETVKLLRKTGTEGIFDPESFKNFFTTGINDVFSVVELSLEDALSEFQINIGRVSLEELSGEEIEKQLQAVFSKQADLIAEFLVPSIAEYQRVGEGLFDTLTRVAQEQIIFNDSINMMGISLSDLSNLIQIDIAQSVINLIGGVERFRDLTSEFFSEFFTEAEKFEQLSNSLNDAVIGLGLSMFDTRDQFRDMIEGLDLTTDAGQELFASLLELVPAFDDLFDSIESQAAKELAEAERLLSTQRREEERALNDARKAEEQALRDLIQAGKEAERALDSLKNAVASAFGELGRSVTAAQAALRIGLNEELKSIDEQFNLRRQNLKDAIDAQIDSMERQLSVAKNQASSLSSLVDSLDNAINTIVGVSRTQATTIIQAAIDAARIGQNLSGMDLGGAISSLTNISPSDFGSQVELQIEQARSLVQLKELQELSVDQLSIAEQSIILIEQQIETIRTSGENQLNELIAIREEQSTSAQAQFDIEFASLQAILDNAQSQLDVLTGIESGIKTLANAQTNFTSSIIDAIMLQVQQGNITGDEIQFWLANLSGLDVQTRSFLLNALSQVISGESTSSDDINESITELQILNNSISTAQLGVLGKLNNNSNLWLKNIFGSTNQISMRVTGGFARVNHNLESNLPQMLHVLRSILRETAITRTIVTRSQQIQKRWDNDGLPQERDIS